MPAFLNNTLVHGGFANSAPGAGAQVAVITAPPPGIYKVTMTAILTGTAETNLRNLTMRENGNTVAQLLPSLTGIPVTVELERVEINEGGGNLDVIAVNAATGGSFYNVVLTATRVS